MYHIESIEEDGDSTIIKGWILDNGSEPVLLRFRDRLTEIVLELAREASPDLVGLFGSDFANSRFATQIPIRDPNGILIYGIGESREIHIPIGEKADAHKILKPLLHQIYEGRYIGRFRRLDSIETSTIVLSQDSPDSSDAIEIVDTREDAKDIYVNTEIPSGWTIDSLNLYFKLRDGSVMVFSNLGNVERSDIEAYQTSEYFFDWIDSNENDLFVAEIGSRARSGVTRRHRINERHSYIGVDIVKGSNVDIVADAHELSRVFEAGTVDAIFGMAVFEHLAMPWKVALELNKVLKLGGRAMFFTHQAWPLHEVPFDFFRFSKESWASLFNEYTGFRILNASVGEPARLIGNLQTNATCETARGTCYLVSSVFVEKVANTQLSWDVPVSSVYKSEYPE